MSRRTLAIVAAVLAVVVVLAIGLSQANTGKDTNAAKVPSAAEQQRLLAGAPAPLAALHRKAGELLPGPPAAVRAQLRALRGHPVVINKWASWCGPCRLEFPVFQRVGVKLGKQVAFLGLDGKDDAGDAHRFLQQNPVPYPSFQDPNEKVARTLEAGVYYPTTVFIGADGKVAYAHQGGYVSDAKLEQDIRRYVLR